MARVARGGPASTVRASISACPAWACPKKRDSASWEGEPQSALQGRPSGPSNIELRREAPAEAEMGYRWSSSEWCRRAFERSWLARASRIRESPYWSKQHTAGPVRAVPLRDLRHACGSKPGRGRALPSRIHGLFPGRLADRNMGKHFTGCASRPAGLARALLTQVCDQRARSVVRAHPPGGTWLHAFAEEEGL